MQQWDDGEQWVMSKYRIATVTSEFLLLHVKSA